MDAEDFGGLRFVVAGGGECCADIVLFEFVSAHEKISARLPVVERGLDVMRIPELPNFFRQRDCIDVAFGSEDHGALD